MRPSRQSVKRPLAPSKKSNRATTSPKKTRAIKPTTSASSAGRTVKARIRSKTGGVNKSKNITSRRVSPKALKDVKIQFGDNRLVHALEAVSFRNKSALRAAVRTADRPMELAPAFSHTFCQDHDHAIRLAEAFALTIKDPAHHRELFQQSLQMPAAQRRSLIQGYRKAGQARGVVHAIGQLPRAQGRTLMCDLVLKEDKSVDKHALRDVLFYLRDAGAEIRRMQKGKPPAPGDTDAAVVDFFEDVADEIANAITSIVDAVVNAVKSLGQALADVVNWVANDVANLLKSLIEVAGKSILDLLNAGLEIGYELVKKIVAGLEDIGQGLFNVLDAAFNLAKDALVTVLRAIDQLGRQLGELLSYLANKTFDIIKRGAEALLAIGKTIGNILQQALNFGAMLVRGFVQALIELGKAVGEILVALVTRPLSLLDAVVAALLQLGRAFADIINAAVNAGLDLVKEIVSAAVKAGQALVEFTKFIANAAADVVKKVLAGLLEAGKLLVDVIKTIATHALAAIKKVVQAFFALGKTLITLLKETLTLGMALLKAVVKAAFELGKTIVEFTKQMVEFTYKTAARLIDAALQVGAKVIDILESVAKAAYFVFRKIINAVLQALGPVGDILGWLLDRGEALASALWREAVLAIRFVKKSITEILDWAAAQTQAAFERIIQLCEDVGAAVTEAIDWAVARGADALDLLGGVWEKVGNSITYALNYLEKDFLPGVAKFVKGALAAGYELAKLIVWTVGKAFEVALEVVRGALEAGATLAELVIDTIQHPDQALQNILRAARQLGRTMNEVVDAFKQAGEDFAERFVRTMKAIGEHAKDMLLAVLEVAVGALDAVVIELMNLLNGFRHLTAAERADAQLVFANSVDLDNAFIATDTPTNDIIFGIQDFFTGNPESRAFVTGNLINFDADEVPIKRYQLIHEMTHVWQNQNVGPIYLGHAIFDQVTMGDAAYNYGYNTNGGSINLPNARYDGTSEVVALGSGTGEGGADDLTKGFMEFGPEQQGQIMMHYFVRRVLLSQPASDYAPWQPYVDFVQTHPQVA